MKHETICLWSGRRNVSTALMYSFAQRQDTQVVDKPLYGHFLRVTRADHPGRDQVLATVDTDGNRVMRQLIEKESLQPLLFLKQMAHHLVELDLGFLRQTKNVFLIRDPHQMLPSLASKLPQVRLSDTGLATQWQLFEDLENAGQRPAALDSRELLLDPPGVLRQLCDHLQIPFLENMLSWDRGPRPEDGIWAQHWYQAVHQSTGFSKYVAKKTFPPTLEPLLAECQPWYEKLYAHTFRATTGGTS